MHFPSDYVHKNKRVVLEAKITMMTEPEDEHLMSKEYVEAIRTWLLKAQKQDKKLVLECKVEGSHPWITQAKQIPLDTSELYWYFSQDDRSDFKRVHILHQL